MKQSCPYCKTIIEINEKEYPSGSTVVKRCTLCGGNVTFTIPKNETVDKAEYDKLLEEIEILHKRIEDLELNNENDVPTTIVPPSDYRENEIDEQAIREEITKELSDKYNRERFFITQKIKKESKTKTTALASASAILGIAVIALIIGLFATNHKLKEAKSNWYYYRDIAKIAQSSNIEANDRIQELSTENQQLNDFKNSVTNTYPIIITDIQIGNSDYGGNIETDYGEDLYDYRTMYLKPKIYYKGLTSGSHQLKVKWYKPSGELSRGSSSPYGYSQESYYTLEEGEHELVLQGWGAPNRGHWTYGTYWIEIWYNDVCLRAESFYIH